MRRGIQEDGFPDVNLGIPERDEHACPLIAAADHFQHAVEHGVRLAEPFVGQKKRAALALADLLPVGGQIVLGMGGGMLKSRVSTLSLLARYPAS